MGGQRPKQANFPARSLTAPLREVGHWGLQSVNRLGGPVVGRLGPAGRAASFYAGAWERWFAPVGDRIDRPVPFPSFALGFGALVDESLLSAARIVRRPLPREEYERIESEVAAAIDLYRQRGWLEDPTSFFTSPPAAVPQIQQTNLFGGLSFERFQFESGYEPDPDDPGRQRWLSHVPNRTAHAWVLRHRDPRPWLVGVHGAGMGYPRADLFAFRAGWLHHALGLNLAFPVMPLHGPRRRGNLPGVGFPNDDLLDTVHGIAQAVWDTRRLVAWIRSNECPDVGIFGLSLGGFAAAVIASTERDLSCVIAGVPAVDFAELFDEHAPPAVRQQPRFPELLTNARLVQRVVSPLALVPQVPHDRRFIFAGLADRLIHPHRQARALWDHWQRPPIYWFEGSHVGFLWSGAVRTFVHQALCTSGMLRGAKGLQSMSAHRTNREPCQSNTSSSTNSLFANQAGVALTG